MNRNVAEAVIRCLRLSGEAPDLSELKRFKARHWRSTFSWLDTSGLALYFFRYLRDREATDLLPLAVRKRFEKNAASNRGRLEYVTGEFASINSKFQRAGVNFAVVKGFSLVPAFCPDASLRVPNDLDYLLDKVSLPAARRALEEAGYRLRSSSDIEFKFIKPSSKIPTFADDPYSSETELLVEL